MSDQKPPFDRAAHCRAAGAKGGRRTAEKYGSDYMSEIGRRGFAAAARTFQSEADLILWLIKRGDGFAYYAPDDDDNGEGVAA